VKKTPSLDSFSTTFVPLESIMWSANERVSINGSHLYLHGVDVHQDHAGGATA